MTATGETEVAQHLIEIDSMEISIGIIKEIFKIRTGTIIMRTMYQWANEGLMTTKGQIMFLVTVGKIGQQEQMLMPVHLNLFR